MLIADEACNRRIHATIAHICEMCPAREQGTIQRFLNHWLLHHSRLNRQQLFSLFSTAGLLRVKSTVERAERRSLALINTNMLSTACASFVSADWILSASPAAVSTRLELFPFRLFALQQMRNTSLLQNELEDLMRDPQLFLQTRPLVCQPYGAPASGTHDYVFYFNYEEQAFTFSPVGMPGPAWFQGNGIRVKANNVLQFQANVMQQLRGADIVMTSEKSARSFARAHGVDAADCVIGFHRNSAWELYAQEVKTKGWHEVTRLDVDWENSSSCSAPETVGTPAA